LGSSVFPISSNFNSTCGINTLPCDHAHSHEGNTTYKKGQNELSVSLIAFLLGTLPNESRFGTLRRKQLAKNAHSKTIQSNIQHFFLRTCLDTYFITRESNIQHRITKPQKKVLKMYINEYSVLYGYKISTSVAF
jgi:hypothetical protein